MPTTIKQLRSGQPLQIQRTVATTAGDNGTVTPLTVPMCDIWELQSVPNAGLTLVYEFPGLDWLSSRIMFINKSSDTTGATLRLTLPVGCTFNSTGTQSYDFPDAPTCLELAFSEETSVFSLIGGESSPTGIVETVQDSSGGGVGLKDTTNSTAADIYIKNLVAGSNVTLTPADETVTIAASGVVETVADSSGGGVGLKDTVNSTATDILLKNLVAGSNVTLTPADETITVAASGVVETVADSSGGGEGLKDTVNSTATAILLKNLVAGSNITLTPSATAIEIAASGGSSPTTISNLTAGSLVDPNVGTLHTLTIPGNSFTTLGQTIYYRSNMTYSSSITGDPYFTLLAFGTTCVDSSAGTVFTGGTNVTFDLAVTWVSGAAATATLYYMVTVGSNFGSTASYTLCGSITGSIDLTASQTIRIDLLDRDTWTGTATTNVSKAFIL
jgi:hypothetical protein